MTRAPSAPTQPRIIVAGIGSESGTFSPHRTTMGDFTLLRGDELLAFFPWIGQGWALGVDWVPTVRARALPGGPVTTETYRTLTAEILQAIADAGPADGVFLDLHGALNVLGYDDVETDFVAAVRNIVGTDCLISASTDLHGNVTRELAATLDFITCFRTAPHVDEQETRERAAHVLVDRLRAGGGRPHVAWVGIPVLLAGEKTSTRVEPAKSVYDLVAEVAVRPGIIDAALWVGYAWADEPRSQAAVVVTGDDATVVGQAAEQIARRYWDVRAEFEFVAPTGTFDECLTTALGSAARPYLISDSGDNPTAGGAGDTSYVLRRLVERDADCAGRRVIVASIVDPGAVAALRPAGVGGQVTVPVGGHIDSGASGPVTLAGRVAALVDDPVGGHIGVLRTPVGDVIITERRKPYHYIDDFQVLGLDLAAADVVIVKIGYLEPELYDAAAGWMMALTPGGVDQDLLRLPYRRVRRPIYPLDPDMPTPALRSEMR